MLVIVEGADGVGKTTFVQHLVQLTGATSLHRGVPEKEPWAEYTDDLLGYRPREDAEHGVNHIVCDRWHWGELIYGPLYRGESKLGWDGFQALNEWLNRRGAIIVYLDHDHDAILRRWSKRGEDYLKPKDLAHVLEAYENIAVKSTVPVLRFRDPGWHDAKRVVTAARVFEYAAAGRFM